MITANILFQARGNHLTAFFSILIVKMYFVFMK